ncbi:MAG: hypothetical protein IJS34_00290 [Alphaproteobacteria bacterium]|nr:hypothetical protein [Alphaproteobacteria bacterium]
MKRLFVMGLLFMFMAVAPVVSLFAAEPELATNSGAISSVTVAGLVAQNGTPTPTTPIDIVSNNGVLKVSPNLFDFNTITSSTISIPIENGKTYTWSFDRANYGFRWDSSRLWGVDSGGNVVTDGVTFISPGDYMAVDHYTFTVVDPRVVAVRTTFRNSSMPASVDNIKASKMMFQIGTQRTAYLPYGQIYTDGEVETIGDSANHTATVATLLGVGDYRDTQNINTGAITRNVGVKVLDGTENWTAYSGIFGLYYSENAITDNNTSGADALDLICNQYTVTDSNQMGDNNTIRFQEMTNGSTHPVTSKRLYVRDTKYSTAEAFKQFLAAQYAAGTPVMIVYPLATETTESVTGQTMTTAPVNNRTGGVTGMTITTLLSSGASVVTTIGANAIKIATTAYNSARFNPVKTDLDSAVATIREIVTKTINQTAAIASLQADKQTRPEDACPAGKKCLLVETEENGVIVPHWFPIIEAPENTE